jgi:hypothetical protein
MSTDPIDHLLADVLALKAMVRVLFAEAIASK